MKGKVQAPLSFSDDLKKQESAKPSASTQRDSPYLKAILSGSVLSASWIASRKWWRQELPT